MDNFAPLESVTTTSQRINQELFSTKFASLLFPSLLRADEYTGYDILDILETSRAHQHNSYRSDGLLTHLFLTANQCLEYAVKMRFLKRESTGAYRLLVEEIDSPWVFYLVGFLHDIGKHGALREYFPTDVPKNRKKYTRGHGCVGCSMLEHVIYTPEFKKQFRLSERDCATIALTVNYHMYGYPLVNNNIDPFRIALLGNTLTSAVVKTMGVLRYGDAKGRTSNTDVFDHDPITSQRRFMVVQREYETLLRKEAEHSTSSNVFRLTNNPGLVISFVGYYSTGKTSRCQQIAEWLSSTYGLRRGVDIFVVEGDVIKERVMKRCAKTTDIFPRDEEDIEKRKRMICRQINREIAEILGSVVLSGRVCLLDVPRCMYSVHKKMIFFQVPPNTIKVDVYTSRYSRIGNAHEKRMWTEPYIFDPLGPAIQWFCMETITEQRNATLLRENNNDRKGRGTHENSKRREHTLDNRHKPHFTIPVGYGKTLMYESLKLLVGTLVEKRREYVLNAILPPLTHVTTNDDYEDYITLPQLLQVLLNESTSSGWGAFDSTVRYFDEHLYEVVVHEISYDTRLLSLEYGSEIRNRLWRNSWMRTVGGSQFLIRLSDVNETFMVYQTRSGIPRSLKILTTFHLQEFGDEHSLLRDMESPWDVHFLSQDLAHVVERLNGGNPHLPFGAMAGDEGLWRLSQKIDGVTGSVTVYAPDDPTGVVLSSMLEDGRLDGWNYVSESGLVVVPSLDMAGLSTSDSKSVWVTALYEQFARSQPSPLLSPDEAWTLTLRKQFCNAVCRIANVYLNEDSTAVTLFFELVCRDGRSYDGLFCGPQRRYKCDCSYFLGVSIEGSWFPSYVLPDVTSYGFNVPRSTIVFNPKEIVDTLRDLSSGDRRGNKDHHPEGFILTRHDRASPRTVVSCCSLCIPDPTDYD